MDQYSVGTRTDRCEERLVRTMILAAQRGDRVSVHSLSDRLSALRHEAILDGAAHDCDAYRLADGDCEVCWLASK